MPGRAIGKGREEFPRRHVVVGEALDQDRRAVFLRQSGLADRDRVARDPGADHQRKGDA